MTTLLLPPLPPGIVAGTPVIASVPLVGVSAEVARHHCDVHACPKTGHYFVTPYECVDHGTMVRVVACEVCGSPLAAIVADPCEHVPALLEDVSAVGAPL